MDKKLLFALDIGTRSVVGLVGEQTGNTIQLLASDRQEHHTRAMLDGQIHDVPEVAGVLAAVKQRLESAFGPLKKVAVAAAGRALCTVRASAEVEYNGRSLLALEDERSLEISAVQSAQYQLATSNSVTDPTGYYCVGYSVVGFTLDDTPLTSLIGQRGRKGSIEIIATFLPRQVIDSLQSALQAVELEMATLTLEPIAAINVLIPHTMRHLNLALVDVGAGTSDVAITRDGSVIGYGMVPCAGDEITEALSQKYLLDFNVAEQLKRQLKNKNKKVTFTDVLGAKHKRSVEEIISAIKPSIGELARAIAAQILALNSTVPQAVLLVGGGSLTPLLPEALAQSLDIPAARVAIRRPETVEGITGIPLSLCTPDFVTPLGILKLAGSRTLNFINVTVNNQPLRLFNLSSLTVADALLAAGIDIRSLHGRPGLGLTITVNGQKKFLPGSMGQPGTITVNGVPGTYGDLLTEDAVIKVTKGSNGETPVLSLYEVLDLPEPLTVTVNGRSYTILPEITVNGVKALPEQRVTDRSQINCYLPATLEEVLRAAGLAAGPLKYLYTINGVEREYIVQSRYFVNNAPGQPATPVKSGDNIQADSPAEPLIGEVLGLVAQPEHAVTVTFNNTKCTVPARRLTLTLNGRPAALKDCAPSGSIIEFTVQHFQPLVNDVLLAANFNCRNLPASAQFDILLNGKPAEYTSPVTNGDSVEFVIK